MRVAITERAVISNMLYVIQKTKTQQWYDQIAHLIFTAWSLRDSVF